MAGPEREKGSSSLRGKAISVAITLHVQGEGGNLPLFF